MEEKPSRVDFSYAFATPHRLTVGRPDDSDRTLLDLQAGHLRMSWTYDDLTRFPLATFKTPTTGWEVCLKPQLDGCPFAQSRWARAEGYLPVLENAYADARGTVLLTVAGGMTAAVTLVEVSNTGDRPHRFSLECQVPGGWRGYNPAFVDSEEEPDHLLAGWGDRADRVVILCLGANEVVVGTTSVTMIWHLEPGASRTGWVIRPYRAYAADLPELRRRDWMTERLEARREWDTLLGRACDVQIPDAGVRNAFYACLADLFIMREPVADGYIAAVPGTEQYRAPNPVEAAIVAVALDQVGLHQESAQGYRMCLDLQEEDGEWVEPKGWSHLMWAASGFKAWALMEHYKLTGDAEYLDAMYPRLAANSRWQERQRCRTRILEDGERPATYGLMPRGMGDAGLLDDGSHYGIFLPHNIWATYADAVAVEAAEILGKEADLCELTDILSTAREDLCTALELGAIQEEGYRWIPGVSGKRCGSRWGVLNALFPCRLLERDHELISGTLRYIESNLSPGGIPVNTGWQTDGMWVAITLDNIAEAHLVRGNGDAAAEYLYAVLNHGTPLITWCEERGQEAGTDTTSGDRQHLWTPVAVVRAVRDMLVMEDGNGLQLALGTARDWLAGGGTVGISSAATHFGDISYSMRYDAATGRLSGEVVFPQSGALEWAELHVRLPGGPRVQSVDSTGGAEVEAEGRSLRWDSPRGRVWFEAAIEVCTE
ncbi:MAG: hypothetical protein MUQ10_18210 [Anaerolineae bacterium]|nr:hypothetical protein [Anaerolineae bacterium]